MSWCDREVRKKARGGATSAAHLVGERTDAGRPVGGRPLSNRSVEALGLRDRQVDRLRDLEVHHELEPGGQLDWQVALRRLVMTDHRSRWASFAVWPSESSSRWQPLCAIPSSTLFGARAFPPLTREETIALFLFKIVQQIDEVVLSLLQPTPPG